MLVTRNTKDFPADRLQADGVGVLTADQYLLDLLGRHRSAVHESFVTVAASRKRPAVTPCELVERIDRAGAPRFAARMRRRLACE